MRFFRRGNKEKERNQFEASLILDNPDIKIVEARYKEKPIFFGVGTSRERDRRVAVEGTALGAKGEYQTQKDLEWHLIYNPENMPGFIPIERFKALMATATAAVSGSASVYEDSTKYETLGASSYDATLESLHEKSKQDELAFAKLRHWLKKTETKREG